MCKFARRGKNYAIQRSFARPVRQIPCCGVAGQCHDATASCRHLRRKLFNELPTCPDIRGENCEVPSIRSEFSGNAGPNTYRTTATRYQSLCRTMDLDYRLKAAAVPPWTSSKATLQEWPPSVSEISHQNQRRGTQPATHNQHVPTERQRFIRRDLFGYGQDNESYDYQSGNANDGEFDS